MDEPGQGQRRVHRQEGVVAVHGHAKLGGDVGHLYADGAQADDAQGLPHELGAHELALALLHGGGHVGPGARLELHPVGAAHHVAGGQQQGTHRQLLHRVGVGAGGVEHHVTSHFIGTGPPPGGPI